MYIKKINLINFKNYAETDLSFSSQINIFTGSNGAGKTNLLDAIYSLSLTKSAFSSSESQSIRHQENFFSILGHFVREEQLYAIQYDLAGAKKTFRLNKNPYEKLSEHIGAFPVVLVTPNDTDVIREGSEERRKFFDAIISQLDNLYLTELIRYNNLLKHRNSLLKQLAERHAVDPELIESYNHQMLKSAAVIYQKRKVFMEEFTPVFSKHYLNLSEEKESPALVYESQLHEKDFEQKFLHNLNKDILLQRTGMGVHKDDYNFMLNGYPVKNYGSQGQQKSFVIALKLAHFDIIKKHKNLKPILLLDDIFDKLDDSRISKLMQMVAEETFGQLFITDARPERTEKIFKQIRAEICIFHIQNGLVISQKEPS
ncbi:MAG TPA: DNA replication/repair protein RecF [Cytophagaceae bacterium]|jgi:DNA replication and repair protein RecF|nr:DNA replication/repair protein RecF [Cytophagaceae bacterium]